MEEVKIDENTRETITSGIFMSICESDQKNENIIEQPVENRYPSLNKIDNSYLRLDDYYENKENSESLLSEREFTLFRNINKKNDKSDKPFYLIIEKGQVKDILSSHLVYEILYFSDNEEKKINCYRRYDNFDKLNNKLRKKYPYLLIPKLTKKHPISKILPIENEFYENRKRQLNFYINYLHQHEFLSETREFFKFVNDAEFDEKFFSIEESPYTFEQSIKISVNISNKIKGVFSSFFWGEEEIRKINDDEIAIKKIATHYKGLVEKYKEIKNNISEYTKTIKIDSEGYKLFSNTCFYLKDSLENFSTASSAFKIFYEICLDVSEVNRKHYEYTGIDIENKFEVKINFNLRAFYPFFKDSVTLLIDIVNF